MTLFGCAFVDRRAKSGQFVRKCRQEELVGKVLADEDIIEAEGIDEDGSVYMLEAGKHDTERWPHLYPADELEVMFPVVVAAPVVENVSIESLGEHRALEERWATRRPVGPTKSQ